jgi:hypothetical protein
MQPAQGLSDRLPETTKGRAHHKGHYPSAARPSLPCFCRLKTRRFPPHSCEKVGFIWKADTCIASRYRVEQFCQGSRYNLAGTGDRHMRLMRLPRKSVPSSLLETIISRSSTNNRMIWMLTTPLF